MAAQDSTKRRQLLLQTEKMLLQPIHPHLFTYCPTMDLLALVTDEENLDVYRINGQRAFGLKRKSEDVAVDALQWEFNGKSIAVSWSDGSTDLVSAETGKVSHKDLKLPAPSSDGDSMLEEEAVSRVKCMGSCLNFIDVDAVKRRTGVKQKQTNGSTPTKMDVFGQPTTDDWDEFMDDTTVDDFLERQPDFQALDIAPDLPDQLAMMDTETLLPKLPAIPLPPALPFMRVSAADSGAFSTQPEVDALLHSHHLKDHNSVGMFIRCSDQGTVHPSIYDSKETVNIQLPIAWNLKSTPLLHASHPYSYSHALLMRIHSPDTARTQLAFVPLTLNFIPSAGIYLHLIATKTSQLQNLLLYITQTLQRIRTYHKHGSDLPSRFMMGISETLEEKNQGDLATNLFHTACTGNCPPLVREWLVDELMEQGHKRWENAVTTSLTTLLALVHENLIPAVDRCALLISRLRGLAQFHDQDWIFTSPVTEFTALLEMTKNMRLLAHTVLLYAGEEKRQFHAFSKWLRFVIDFEATEPDSNSRMEMEGRDAGVDTLLVLDYIRYSLGKSNLQPYLQPEAQLGSAAKKGGAASYEDTVKAIEVLKEGGKFKEEALCLEHVLGGFRDGVGGLLRQVSRWQEGNVQMDSGVVLEDMKAEEEGSIDMKMMFEPASGILTYIAYLPPSSPHTLLLHRINHTPSITSLPKDIISHAPTTLAFPTGSHVLDAKFADDTTLLVLLQHPPQPTGPKETRESAIVAFTYAPLTKGGKADIQFSSKASSADVQSCLLPAGAPPSAQERHTVEVTAAMVEERTRHVFEGRWTPLKLVVNGRKGRRVVVVLGSDKKHYRILDMDYRQRGRLQDADGGGEAGSDTDTAGDGDTEMGGA